MRLAFRPEQVKRAAGCIREGRVSDVVGPVIEASGCDSRLGDVFELRPGGTLPEVRAQVVGFRGDRALLMALGALRGVGRGTPLRKVSGGGLVPVGRRWIGRVFDGLGRPLDGGPMPMADAQWPLDGDPSHPLRRRPVEDAFPVGVKAIDGLLTLGVGQRIGIFAGGGVGKSTLLGMMVRRAECDVCVVALVGERGREVEELVRTILGPEGLSRSVVVAATSADPPLVRARSAEYATAIAEYFRDQGKKVLLVMDSVTRYAMALREIGLAIGEPPATKGYTPSVFAALPRLMERAGTSIGEGAITGIYTVLVEGDDLNDPIADASRAILDGHIVLRRELAERGHYPAIDVAASLSRVMRQVVSPNHRQAALRVRDLMGRFREAEDLMSIGAYRPGLMPGLDKAVERMPALTRFLRENIDGGGASIEGALRQLDEAIGEEVAS